MGIWKRLLGILKRLFRDETEGAERAGSQSGTSPSASLQSADQAVKALFEGALPAIASIGESQIRKEYSRLSKAWGNKQLFEGSEDQVRSLVHRNLEQLAASPAFEDFRVQIYKDQQCAQVEAFFPRRFIGIRVWRSEEGFFVCGNYLFGESPKKPDLDRVGKPREKLSAGGKIQVRVSADAFGRAIKEFFEYLLQNYSDTTFSNGDLPAVSDEFLKQVRRIESGDRRPGDPTLVMREGRCSDHEVAQSMILHELRRALLIEVEPGGWFTLTKKGKNSVILLA